MTQVRHDAGAVMSAPRNVTNDSSPMPFSPPITGDLWNFSVIPPCLLQRCSGSGRDLRNFHIPP